MAYIPISDFPMLAGMLVHVVQNTCNWSKIPLTCKHSFGCQLCLDAKLDVLINHCNESLCSCHIVLHGLQLDLYGDTAFDG